MTSTLPDGPGGFLPESTASPTPSSASTATPSSLPRQRTHPLRAGSMKETSLINYVDKTILGINRRHAKKFSRRYDQDASGEEGETEAGYESFSDVVHDIEPLVDLIWVSGTPTLQIPYLISLAVLTNSFLPSYPFSPGSTFRLLRKLDAVFASLLTGQDVETETPLPGFENRSSVVSMTEKVRIKSVAESCRVAVVEARERGGEGGDNEAAESDEEGDDMVDELDPEGFGETVGRWEMEAARVYERTIQLLGDELGKQGEFGVDGTGQAC